MKKKCFAVQFVIEDDRCFESWNYAKAFIADIKETLLEDFPEYKILSVDSADIEEGETVKKLSIIRTPNDVQYMRGEN